MKNKLPVAVLFSLTVAGASLRADPLEILLGKPEVDVITFTEMTPAGRRLSPPTLRAPVYYIAATSGFKDLGGVEAGKEKLPDHEAIRIIAKVLAGEGYLPANGTTPAPGLLLVFTWGTLNPELVDGEQVNLPEMLNFVGIRNMRLMGRSAFEGDTPFHSLGLTIADAEKLQGLGAEDLYVATVSAYDVAAAQGERRELLWITRITCPAAGIWLRDVMPAMLAMAAPHLGRETTAPVWVNVADRYKPEVKIHDLKLLEYLEKGPLPVLEKSSNKTK